MFSLEVDIHVYVIADHMGTYAYVEKARLVATTTYLYLQAFWWTAECNTQESGHMTYRCRPGLPVGEVEDIATYNKWDNTI